MVAAASAEHALALPADLPVDLMILDLLLPGVDGWQLAAELRIAISRLSGGDLVGARCPGLSGSRGIVAQTGDPGPRSPRSCTARCRIGPAVSALAPWSSPMTTPTSGR